jgi:hypothetical protein
VPSLTKAAAMRHSASMPKKALWKRSRSWRQCFSRFGVPAAPAAPPCSAELLLAWASDWSFPVPSDSRVRFDVDLVAAIATRDGRNVAE